MFVLRVFIFSFFISSILLGQTLIPPEQYARNFQDKDPFSALKAPEKKISTTKKHSLKAGTPRVIRKYPQTVLLALQHYAKTPPHKSSYSLQLYSSANKEKAEQLKQQAKKLFPDYHFSVIFERPYFKLRAAPFFSRQEALKAKAELKKHFPGTFLIAPK